MKNECNIVRDLLPLYSENMASVDSTTLVEEHLKSCETCRAEYERVRDPRSTEPIPSAAPLQKLSRRLRAKRIQTIVLTAVFVMAMLVSAFAVLDAPIYLPYSEDRVKVQTVGDNGLILIFDEKVTAFTCTVRDDAADGIRRYDVETWTSLWNRRFSRGKGRLSTTVAVGDAKPVEIVYVPNDRTENVCIARYDPSIENKLDTTVEHQDTLSLPRLSLGYFLILALAAAVFLSVVWLFVRRKEGLRVWVERVMLYPMAYIISHCIVSGINWASYSLPRDFCLTVFISLLLYAVLLLVHGILRIKLEIRKTNGITG